MKVEQEVPNEFLLVLDDGGPGTDFNDVFNDDEDQKPGSRLKGAYYKNIERKMLLKKKRANVSVPLTLTALPLLLTPPRRTNNTKTSGTS